MESPVLVSVLGGMGTFLVLHLVIWRLRPSNSPRIVLMSYLSAIGMLVSAAWGYRLAGPDALLISTALWIDFFLVIAYMFIYAGFARSVSVTLIEWVHRTGGQGMELDAIVQRYSESSRFEDRIQVMHDSGLLILSGDSATLTPKGRLLAKASGLLERAILEHQRG